MELSGLGHTMTRAKGDDKMTLRNLTANEKGLLKRILCYPCQHPIQKIKIGSDERVEQILPDGTLEFRTSASSKQWYYPVEARFVDADGVLVSAVIFAVENEVSMLEILKADGSVPLRWPKPEEWEIFDLSTAGA